MLPVPLTGSNLRSIAMQLTQVAYGGCWKCPHAWQRWSASTPCLAACQKSCVHSFGTGIGLVTLLQSLIVPVSAHRCLESAQHIQVSLREGEARPSWLGDEGGRAEGLPRLHLFLPAVGVLAGEADAALERERGGIAAGFASVVMNAGDERVTLGVGREVRAPAVGEPRDPPQRGLGWHRLIAAAHAEPDGDRPLDGHGIEPRVADPVELAAEID